MSFQGQLLKAGIWSDGKSIEFFHNDGTFTVKGDMVVEGSVSYTSVTEETVLLQIGTEASPVDLTAAANRGICVWTQSDETSGTIRSTVIDHTQTGASYTTKIEALRVNIDTAVMTGDWCNAIVGVISYTAPGTAGGGMAAAICAELNLPAQAMGGGTYTNFHTYLGVPTNCVLEDSTTHVVSCARFEAGGGAVASFDSYGQLFQIAGLTAGATKLLSAQSQTLKVLVGSTQRYMVLSTAENCLTLSGGAIGIDLGDCTTLAFRAISQTQAVMQIVSAVTLSSADVNVVSISATSVANADKEMRALYVQAYPSTAAQATAGLVAGRFEADVANALNTDYMKAVYAYLDLSEASTIATGAHAVFARVNVDAATTLSAGACTAVYALVEGDSALTGILNAVTVDIDMDVDAAIDVDVATGKTATVGIELGVTGTGTYTTGIVIGDCQAGIAVTSTPSGGTAAHCINATVTDTTATAGGDAAGLHVSATYTGDHTGTGWKTGIAIDYQITGNNSYCFAESIWIGDIGDGVISSLSGLYIYMEDIGAGGGTCAHKFCLDLNQNGDASTTLGFIRVYNHGGTATDSVIYLGNNGADQITNLLQFSAAVAPYSAGAPGDMTADGKILIDVGGTPMYIALYA